MTPLPTAFFPDAHGWTIEGVVNNVAGDMFMGAPQQPYGLGLLRSKASPNAHHDGEDLVGPTRCDPGTRVAIIEDIESWIINPSTKPFLWLNGAAGTGKSAIALSIAARCQEKGRLAASFMFWDGDCSRNSLEHFVPTIADQIATTFPVVGRWIDRTIAREPHIMNKPAETQWKRLVIDAVRANRHQPRAVIVIDGLDECKNRISGMVDTHQRRLLDLIWVASQTPNFPFVFLIASRPEPEIANVMASTKFRPLVQSPITLGETPECQEEMRTVATRNILERGEWYSHILPADRDHDLVKKAVEWMVGEARGEWVFIATIFRDLDQTRGDPYKRLDEIRRCAKVRAVALAPLDHLYTTIVARALAAGTDLAVDILLSTACYNQGYTSRLSFLAKWFGVDMSEIRSALQGLHSVLDVPQDDNGFIKFHHNSFHEFLFEPGRSIALGLNRPKAYARISRRCFENLRLDDVDIFQRASFDWMNFCPSASHDDPLLLEALKGFEFDKWLDYWSVHGDVEIWFFLVRSYSDFLTWLEEWPSHPPQFQVKTLDGLMRKFLDKLTNGISKEVISWIMHLAVTPGHHVLDWDGFEVLYRDHLQPAAIPRLLRNFHCSWTLAAFGFEFFRDPKRSHHYHIDAANAMEDFTVACLSILAKGKGITDDERSAFDHAKAHWPTYFPDNLPASQAILEYLVDLLDTLYMTLEPHDTKHLIVWLQKFEPPSRMRNWLTTFFGWCNTKSPQVITPHLRFQASMLRRKLGDQLRCQ